ncbi:lipase family protein [Nocardia sp. NPDC059177]|uniref:lipase family protein n=1 Tax=Nocardia sp. NPDC059177 TaxID=3346759 RepID=UPI003690ECA4
MGGRRVSTRAGKPAGMPRLMVAVFSATLATTLGSVPAVMAQAPESFYSYDGAEPLASLAPGAVLKTRTLEYHADTFATPLTTIQVLYRSTDSLGNPTANVTTIIKPPAPATGAAKVVSFLSAYDSLNPAHSPSRAFAADIELTGLSDPLSDIASSEVQFFAPLLMAGYTIVIPDTEGPAADFAAGPEYGRTTLDSLRAARHVTTLSGIDDTTKIGLMGYSGGAIAANWAAIEAPSYAPDINEDLIGVAEGGVLVDPAHNLNYVAGSPIWAGVIGMAIVGISRSFDVDFSKYLSDTGRRVLEEMQDASIMNVLAQYPGLTWAQMALPEYADPNSIPEYVDVVNKLNMGTAPTPTVPMFIAQGANGILEGTPAHPGFGAGDGVMITGDVRALANQYCAAGLAVQYDQYDAHSHVTALIAWAPAAQKWLIDRFDNQPAPTNCGNIPAGNPLTPERHAHQL